MSVDSNDNINRLFKERFTIPIARQLVSFSYLFLATIMVNNLHFKRLGTFGDGSTNTAHTEQAQRFAANIRGQGCRALLLPAAGAYPLVPMGHISCHTQQQSQG